MFQIPSWKWLSSPFTRRAEQSALRAQKVAVRPCLPIIEQLDDRILLDATAPAVTTAGDGGGSSLLIGLLTKAAALSAFEFAAIGDIKGESTDDKHRNEIRQLGADFLKIDRILAEFGNNVLGGTTDHMWKDSVLFKLQETFVKIDAIVKDLGGGTDSALLPAVQKVREAALGDGSVYKLISALPGNLGGISTDDLQKVMKISDIFLKIDGFVIKGELDVISEKVGPDHHLSDNLSDAFVKLDGLIGSISNVDLQTALKGFERQFEGITGVLNPGQAGGGFTGGVSVVGGTLT